MVLYRHLRFLSSLEAKNGKLTIISCIKDKIAKSGIISSMQEIIQQEECY